jgi:thiamine-phosphate pyrophosphorylase
VIIDRAASGSRDLAELAAAAIRGGADVIQLRDKAGSAARLIEEARRLLPLARAAGIPLIINDRVEAAEAVGADGVHLGQDDGSIEEARRLLGPERLIGRSTHSLEQALAAERDGADYIGLGPIFPTPTKPGYGSVGTALIQEVMRRVQVPVVCIGGIDATTLRAVLEAGAACVAVVRAACGAEDPERAARELKRTLTQFVRATVSPSL